MRLHRVLRAALFRRFLSLAATGAVVLFTGATAFASPEQCAANWVERNRPFAERGLCVDTPLWKTAFPGGSCTQTTGSDISLPPDISDRLTEIRAEETQLGCRIDSYFDDPVQSARSLWLDSGDQASIYSPKDGYANVRDAPSAKSGKLTGMLENGSQLRIVERVQSPDNGALWFKVRYPDNIGRLHEAFVHYATVFPRREVMGFLDIAPAAQLELVDLGSDMTMPVMLRVRFWTDEYPSDIWPVLAYPSFIRAGQEQRKFSVAFTALDWKGGELETVSSRCEWQPNKRHAACEGGAGRFQIIAVRDQTTWKLRSFGVILDSAAGEAGRLVFAGFGQQVNVGAITGRVQLGIAIEGIETLKIGVLLDQPESAARSAPAAATPSPVEHPSPPSQSSPSSEETETPADLSAQSSETLVDFDDLLDLIE